MSAGDASAVLARAENTMRRAAVRAIDVLFAVATWSWWPNSVGRPLLRVAIWLVRCGALILDGLQEEE